MKEEIKLTQSAKSAGCAAKLSPNILSEVVGKLPKPSDKNLLVGVETSDDAAVYQVSDELALIQTVDFFPPMVDDPYTFGQIAAANALSDIYAMGGEPKLALNIVAFPNCLGAEVLGEILAGGAAKAAEAGVVLAGGHSINDEEPKYGLCVTGFVNPQKFWKNAGAKPEDVLVLTKPLGVGIINTAVKAELASEEARKAAVASMTTLNRKAMEIFRNYEVHSCTDITGFSLAGHALEMAKASGVTLEIETEKLEILPEALDYAAMGLVPEGAYRNRMYQEPDVYRDENISETMVDLLYDPQTSGGLLFSMKREDAQKAMAELASSEYTLKAAVIGKVTEKQEKYLAVYAADRK